MPEHEGSVSLRSAHLDDVERLVEIRTTPEVRHWWRGDPDGADIGEHLTGDDVEVRTIERGGRIVGLVQFAEEDDPEYRHAGIDLFVDPTYHRQGIGSAALRLVIAELVDERGHHRLTIDPAADNAAAIACYAAVGFVEIGRMRRYEQRLDGSWGDGLLMEYVVEPGSSATAAPLGR